MQLAIMPLDRVPVASLDLETTGLRAQTDRIVQIGAIRSDEAAPPFAALVRPGVPIPVTSTRIHQHAHGKTKRIGTGPSRILSAWTRARFGG